MSPIHISIFRRMTVRALLGSVIGFLAVLTVGVGLLGLYGMDSANAGLRTVYLDRTVALEQVSRVDRLLWQIRLTIEQAELAETTDASSAALKRVEAHVLEIDATWAAYMATYLTPEEKELATAFAAERSAWTGVFLAPSLEALRSGNIDVLKQVDTQNYAANAQLARRIDALRSLQVEEARREFEKSGQLYDRTRSIMIAVILVGTALAAAMGVGMARTIGRQLGGEPAYAARIVRRIAAGDLGVDVTVREGDRTSLLFAMREMRDSLAAIVNNIHHGADAIMAAAGQIADGNLDLSTRTEQQAGALEETASTMEELTATVKQYADNARHANQLALDASSVAVNGGKLVGQVVDRMGAISASARKMEEIISVIDGIAFQTNILALNAAVEAARAGEQGRGFAVVAGEVRNLAHRSAAAAKEISALIAASVGEVDAGTHLVDQAGAIMQEVVGGIRSVSDTMAEMATAGSEQANGIAQVNTALAQMDETTQQNAALVEEAAAAAASMREQAAALTASINKFSTAAAPARHFPGSDDLSNTAPEGNAYPRYLTGLSP